MMILTDGAETIKAIEYQPWRNISEDMLLPGTKVNILSPSFCSCF